MDQIQKQTVTQSISSNVLIVTKHQLFLLSPHRVNLVGTKTLRKGRVLNRRFNTVNKREQTRVSDHRSIINAVTVIRSKQLAVTLRTHRPHHLLQTLVTPDTSNYQNILLITMRHRSFRDLYQHRKHRLLQEQQQQQSSIKSPKLCIRVATLTNYKPYLKGIAQVCWCALVVLELLLRGSFDITQDSAERNIHTFDSIRKIDKVSSFLSKLDKQTKPTLDEYLYRS